MSTLTTVFIRTVVSLAVVAVTVDALVPPRPTTSIEAFETALGAMRCHTLGPVFRQGRLVGWQVFGDGLPRDVVQSGDVITAVNGQTPTPAAFTAGFDGAVLTLTVERDGVPFEVVLHEAR